MWLIRRLRVSTNRESGVTLIETLVALAILGTISVTFLSGLTTAGKAVFIADERAKAESLAQSQMEWIKNSAYVDDASEYTPAIIPTDKGYINYSAIIDVEPLHDPDLGIQKIIITIIHSSDNVVQLTSYKVDR